MIISGTADSIYKTFEQKLSSVNKKEILYNFTKGILISAALFLITGLILVLLEFIFNFNTPVRKIFYWGFLSLSVTTFVYFISNYFLKLSGIIKPPGIISYSKKIGYYFDEVKDKMSNSISLYEEYAGNKSGKIFSSDLITADLEETNRLTQNVDLNSVISFSKLKSIFIYMLTALLLNILSFSVFPSEMTGALNRIINYNYIYLENGLGITFKIMPGNTEVGAGSNQEIKITVMSSDDNFKADLIELHTKSDGNTQESEVRELIPGPDGSFTSILENLNNSVVYFASYKNIKSDEFVISVSDYPVIKSFTVSVYPPEFTGLPSKTLEENEGNVYCQEGSTVVFDLKSNKALSYAGILLNGKSIDFQVNGLEARGSLTAAESGEYSFVLKDDKGSQSKSNEKFSLKVLKDESPGIIIIEPSESNYVLKGEKQLLVRSRITDDFGFSGLKLGFRKLKLLTGNAPAPSFITENIPLVNKEATSVEVPYLWNISNLKLRQGESAEYYLEVTDNNGKSTRSEIRTIEYRSLAAEMRKNEQMTKELNTDMNSIYEQAEELQKLIQEMKKESQNNEELGLNEEKKQQLENKIENFKNSLSSTQNKIEQSLNELQQKNMLSEKTLEQYMELQKMFNKINTPELQKMLERLKEALKKSNPDELKEAMKNFKFDEEEFRKYMEKAMELLKKIENMQKFGELTQKLDEITKKQEDLNKETKEADKGDKNKLDELSNKQSDLKNDTKEFSDELKKLIDEMNKMKEQLSAEDLEKLKKNMEQKNVDSKMQKSSDQLKQSQKQNSEKTQEDIMNDLNDLNQQMQDALSNMMDSQDMQNRLLDKMEALKKQLEEMSRKQQELRDRTDELNRSQKDEFEKNKTEQAKLQNELSQAIDDIMNLTSLGMMMTPEMGKELGNAFNKMDKAGKDLGAQKKENASSNQGKAKESLDNAAKMLGDRINSMCQNNGNDGKGKKGMKPGQGNMGQLMQRLGDIIAQQMGLNGKLGKTGQDGKEGNDGKGKNPESLTQQQRIELQRLKLEQEQIQKSLEQLNEELKKEQERSGEKVLGDLGEVSKEMKEIVKELEENRVDDKLIEKQNRILSRLLDAQLSQREKDFEPKRESRPGVNITRNSPPEIVLQGPNSYNALKEDFLKLQQEGFSEEYEAIIGKYLMELKKNGLKIN